MIPMLTVTGAEGLVYVNGRLSGETGGAAVPLAPDGIHYLEIRPFAPETPGAVLRLVLREGRLRSGPTGNVFAISWPDGWIALEMQPAPEAMGPAADPLLLSSIELPGGRYLLVDEGGVPSFGRDAGEALFLPVSGVGASALKPLATPGLCAAEGDCAGGRYVAILKGEDGPQVVHCAVGPMARLSGQTLTNVEMAGDLVGHTSLCTYAPDGEGRYALISREPAFEEDGPRWPQTPMDTARAWLEAIQAGAFEEAAGYLEKPVMMAKLERDVGLFDTIVELPRTGYGGIALGLLTMVGPNQGDVRQVSFDVTQKPDGQGDWKITAVML